MARSTLLLVTSLAALAALQSGEAKPWLFFNEPAKAADQAVDQLQAAGSEAAKQAGSGELNQRIQGHLSELYSHGSSAVKSVVHQVQPDLAHIGGDLKDAYAATRDNVNKKIEPLTHTMRPYIDHAQKVVAPYVNQAKEEVPKLLNQVGGQVKERISGVWDKLKPQPSGAPAAAALDQAQQSASNAIQAGQEQLQQQLPAGSA